MVSSAYNTTMSMTIGMYHTAESTPHWHILHRKREKKKKNTKLVFIAWLLHRIARTNVGFLCLLTVWCEILQINMSEPVCVWDFTPFEETEANNKKTYTYQYVFKQESFGFGDNFWHSFGQRLLDTPARKSSWNEYKYTLRIPHT